MKVLNTVNNGIQKFAKGMFALFMINLLIFGGMLLVQSCQTDNEIFENDNQKLALQKFENLVKETTPKIQNVVDKQKFELSTKNINSKEDKARYEEEAKIALQPLMEGSKELFYSFDLNDSDFNDILNGNDPVVLAMLGLTVLSVKSEKTNKSISLNNINSILGIQTANAQDWSEIGSCAAGVLGLNALDTLKDALGGKKVTKKALTKALGVAAKKFGKALTGWGGIIMAAEFGICVGLVAIANSKL